MHPASEFRFTGSPIDGDSLQIEEQNGLHGPTNVRNLNYNGVESFRAPLKWMKQLQEVNAGNFR